MKHLPKHLQIFLAVLCLTGYIARIFAAAPPPMHAPTEPINIDIGRQLFVDDYLVSESTLIRVSHQPRLRDDNPVLKPETPVEAPPKNTPTAAVYDDGVFYDPEAKLFKMWYSGGWMLNTCYAESEDGIHWKRPKLNIFGPDNRVMQPSKGLNGSRKRRDGGTVWLDTDTTDPAERYKAYQFSFADTTPGQSFSHRINDLFVSADGIHWSAPISLDNITGGDNSSIFYNPFRKSWVLSLRRFGKSWKGRQIRVRSYLEAANFKDLAQKTDADVIEPWITTDKQDVPDPVEGDEPEIFKFSAGPYESIMLGAYGINYGPEFKHAQEQKRPMIIDLQMGYSRDGFHFERPFHTAFIAAARKESTWNRGFLHSAGGLCLVMGDELWFYFSGWSGVGEHDAKDAIAGGATGIAVLRRDGFVSLDAESKPGSVTTKQLVFKGKHPFVNADTKGGELLTEILDADGKVIAPFSKENCVPVKGDSTKTQLAWKDGKDPGVLAGKPIRFRFTLTKGSLYAFWVSRDLSGASYGYVAAGGPGFTSSKDTTGGF